jgi:hypothetical protein
MRKFLLCVFISGDEQDPVFPFDINEDDDTSDSVQSQTNQIVPDTNQIVSDTNQKITKPKHKPIKASKSLPETNSLTNTKKRRQTLRRTVQFSAEKNLTHYSIES